MTDIMQFQSAHKATKVKYTLEHLTQAQKALLDEFNWKTKRKFALSHKFFYEYANKSSRLLARILAKKSNMLRGHSLKTETSQTVHNDAPNQHHSTHLLSEHIDAGDSLQNAH